MSIERCQPRNLNDYTSTRPASEEIPPPTDSTRRTEHNARRAKMFNVRGFQDDRELFQFMRLYAQRSFQHNLAATASLKKGKITNFGSLIARYMPRWQGPDAAARRLNDWMFAARDTGRSLFDQVEFWADGTELPARFQLSQVVKETHSEFLSISAGKNLSKDQLNRNWLDLVDTGLDKRAAEINQNGNTRWEEARRAKHQVDLEERLRSQGYTETEIRSLEDMLTRQAGVYDGALGIAQANRVELESLRGRYNPRFFTPEMRDIMRKHKLTELGMSPNNTKYYSTVSDRLFSRETFEWGVNDELLLADAIGFDIGPTPAKALIKDLEDKTNKYVAYAGKLQNRPKGRTDAQQAAMERRFDELGNELGEAERAVAEAKVLAHGALQEHMLDDRTLSWDFAKMHEEKLDALVDSGVVGKLPISTTRVLDVLVERYQLPDFISKEVGRAVVVDPVRSFDMYKESMQSVMGDSMLINEMHVNAISNGFGISKELFESDRAKYRDYRPMGTLMDKYNIPSTNEAAKSVYLDKYAFDQMDAILSLSTEPAASSALARAWMQFTKYWKTALLSTVEYVFRNSYETVVQGWRAGTNLALIPTSMQYLRDYMRFGPDALPTEKVFANGKYSVRDIFESMVSTRELELEAPMGGERLRPGVTGDDDYQRLRRMAGYSRPAQMWYDLQGRFGYMSAQLRAGDVIGTLRYAAGSIVEGQRQIYNAVTMPLAFFTDSMKLANMLTTLDSSRWARVGQFFTGAPMNRYENLDDAKRHLNEYMFRYDRGGVIDRALSGGIPFWNYFSTSMPASIRNIMENPAQHIAYQRLYTAINGDAREDEDFTEAATPPWFGNQMPIVFKDPNGRENMWFSVDMSRLDPHMDLMRRLSEATTNIMRARGRHVGRFDQYIEDSREQRDGAFFRDVLGQMNNPVIQLAIAAWTQKNPFTEADFETRDTLLGFDIGPVGPASGGFTKYVITTLAPQLNYVERTLRNQGVLPSRESAAIGSRTQYFNAAGELDVRPEVESAFVRALSVVGFSPQLIDGYRNLQRTEASLTFTSQDIRRQAGRLLSEARRENDTAQREDLLIQVAKLRALAVQVEAMNDMVKFELESNQQLSDAERKKLMYQGSREAANQEYEQMTGSPADRRTN